MSVFVQPPSVEELRRRLEGRGTDSAEMIEKRLSRAAYELEFAPRFDYIVINDKLEKACEDTRRIIEDFWQNRNLLCK